MQLIAWESLLPIQEIFGDDVPPLDVAGFDLAADVYEQNGGIVVEMQLPGVTPGTYDVRTEDGVLVVSGRREKKTEIEDKDYYRKEIQRGSFERRVQLPEGALNTKEIRPDIHDGVLKIFIPKA